MKEGIELEAPKEEIETQEPDRMTIPILFFQQVLRCNKATSKTSITEVRGLRTSRSVEASPMTSKTYTRVEHYNQSLRSKDSQQLSMLLLGRDAGMNTP